MRIDIETDQLINPNRQTYNHSNKAYPEKDYEEYESDAFQGFHQKD